jgi:hypothetical protein
MLGSSKGDCRRVAFPTPVGRSPLKRFRLRTKFLLSLLVITAGLTSVTLLIVRYDVEKQVRNSLQEDLRNSVNTYQSFEGQRHETLTRSAELLANLPIVRSLMTTQDDDHSGCLGRNLAPKRKRFAPSRRPFRARQEAKDWWFSGRHLYEVWIQPIHLGAPSENSTIGFLAVGHEINARAAEHFGRIAASEVAFYSGDTLVEAESDPPRRENLVYVGLF